MVVNFKWATTEMTRGIKPLTSFRHVETYEGGETSLQNADHSYTKARMVQTELMNPRMLQHNVFIGRSK